MGEGVDQSAKKLTKLLDKETQARIIQCSKLGSYSARNLGLRQGDSEIVAFTDSNSV